jgi:hypothetical protein
MCGTQAVTHQISNQLAGGLRPTENLSRAEYAAYDVLARARTALLNLAREQA